MSQSKAEELLPCRSPRECATNYDIYQTKRHLADCPARHIEAVTAALAAAEKRGKERAAQICEALQHKWSHAQSAVVALANGAKAIRAEMEK